jgi:hypothetical protein
MEEPHHIPFEEFKKKSPIELLSLVGRHIAVTLADNSKNEGFIFTIDPETFSLLLVNVIALLKKLIFVILVNFRATRGRVWSCNWLHSK